MRSLTTKEKKPPKSTYVGLKLNKRTDADILEAIGDRTVRQAELKRLMRIGMEELARRRKRKMMEKMKQQQ